MWDVRGYIRSREQNFVTFTTVRLLTTSRRCLRQHPAPLHCSALLVNNTRPEIVLVLVRSPKEPPRSLEMFLLSPPTHLPLPSTLEDRMVVTGRNQARLLSTSRPRFFFADDSDSDESTTEPSCRSQKVYFGTRPVTNIPQLVKNRAGLPWDPLVKTISRYRDPLMLYKLSDFDFHSEIADWQEVCVMLEHMRQMCGASDSDTNLTNYGETEKTPCLKKKKFQNEHLEDNTASRVHSKAFLRTTELNALTDTKVRNMEV
ncbi:hypothetical protein BU17DRAFT_64165 [Hysterangium stoloniferum]|nr:hypothetical protein BU17DRAFT_64165 [Hysterangium stoloniferum]